MATETVENYLKALYTLSRESPAGEAGMTRLAATVGVTTGTATTMVKKLAAAKLVKYEKNRAVKLSAKGEKLALAVVRRHRIVETFLVRTLDLDWADVHEEAERLEHAVSDRLVDKLDAFLGHPGVDPHGDPIPGPDGLIRETALVALSACKLGAKLRVSRVLDQSGDFLRFVGRSGLRPGVIVSVAAVEAGAGTITLKVGAAAPVTLSNAAAAQVLVQPA
jgi:DtxR family Mn-dependent transcriptional regulator